MAVLGYFQKLSCVQKVTDFTLKVRISAERGKIYLNFYRSGFFNALVLKL